MEVLVLRSGSSTTTEFDLSDVLPRVGLVDLMSLSCSSSPPQYLANIWTSPHLCGRWLVTLRHHFPTYLGTHALGYAGTYLLACPHEYLGT